MDRFERAELLIGADGLEKLKNSHIAVFGVGGVGGYTVEALVRAGVGKIDVFDPDKVVKSNLNRQIIALESTIGKYKVDVISERAKDINPNVIINANKIFYLPENADSIDLSKYDYIVDAIDTVSAKIELAKRADDLGKPMISAMGAGNKLDPTRFEVTDIYKTSVCPLAKVMRKELKNRGVKKLKVVYSREEAIKVVSDEKRPPCGSVSFVPSVAGLIMAGEIVKDLITEKE